MNERYCVTIPEAPKHHEHDTMAALLEKDGTLEPLRVFESIDDALDAARLDKIDHPDLVYEVRRYYGNNTRVLDIEQKGRWNLSAEVFGRA